MSIRRFGILFFLNALFCLSNYAYAGSITGVFESKWINGYNLTVNNNSTYVLSSVDGDFMHMKERDTDNYLNIEYGFLQSSPILNGWWSAQWKLIPLGSGSYQIQNRWYPSYYLNVENGSPQASPINSSWLSAQWMFKEVKGQTPTPVDPILPTLLLSVTKTGQGLITSSPIGNINCGQICSNRFPLYSTIELNAQPAAGYIFGGWSGNCQGISSCKLEMLKNKSAKAKFVASKLAYKLDVSALGKGIISSSSPSGINNCKGRCAKTYKVNTVVILTAKGLNSSTFTGWGGACQGVGSCQITMDNNKNVWANFIELPPKM